MSQLPGGVRLFVNRQKTLPVKSLWEPEKEEHLFPYGEYWYPAMACLLLSGRVGSKYGGSPNLADINRVCKEANFNQYASEAAAKFLVAGGVLKTTLNHTYQEGPYAERFWKRDPEGLRAMGRRAVLTVAHGPANMFDWSSSKVEQMRTLDLLTMFFRCFAGKAMPEKQVVDVLKGFCALPEQELAEVAEGIGLTIDAEIVAGWRHWLDAARTPAALLSALYLAGWAYVQEEEREGVKRWWFASPVGLTVLGLEKPGPLPALSEELEVKPDGSVRAGAGLGPERLIPLFRYCAFRQIGEVLEFQIERKRLAEAPAEAVPGESLRRALEGAGPLPDKVEQLLGTESTQGGTIEVRWCSALIRPENEEVMAAIRKHPQLKNYLEQGAPPGYLLIKPGSRPDNFVRRCQTLGFKVQIL